MLHLHSISKAYGTKPLFSDVSFTVGEKEKVGVMGRNGYGKSTFFRLITGDEAVDNGSVEIPEKYSIRKLEQHLRFEYPTLLEQVASSLPEIEKEQDWRAKSILMGLGFKESEFDKSPFDFSSGFQVRIRLAQALVSDCDLLLLDEPTNYLDIVSLRWLKNFLQNWNKAFLLITHDLGFMTDVTTHSAIIHRGKIRKMKGDPLKLLTQIEKDEEVYEKTRVMQEKKQAKTEHFIKNFRAGARSAGLVQSRIKMLDKQETRQKLDKLPQIKFNFPAINFSGDHLMRTHNICFGYDEGEDNMLIKKLTFEINAHDRIAIIGRNGKGKSTLLRLLGDILKPQTGHLKKYHTLERGYFGQEAENTIWIEQTILSELLSVTKITETQARSIAAALLFTGNDVKKRIRDLSGGEKARVRLGKLMLKKYHLLLLDEPSNHLDIESVQKLIESLEAYEGAMVIVSHDERLLSRLATKLIIFDDASEEKVTVFNGGYLEFLEEGGWGDDDVIKEKKEKKKTDNPKKEQRDMYLEKKKLRKELRQAQKRQVDLEKENSELEKQIQKLSFQMHKAVRSGDSPEVARVGKLLKECNDQTEKNNEETEEMIMKELELGEILGE